MPFLRKYNTLLVTGTTSLSIPIIKRGLVDFAVGADWTPVAGDVKAFVDGAVAANITNLPTAIASGNGAFWEFILTAAELSCKQLLVVVSDAATKAVEDQSFVVETYGNASAMYVTDLSAQLATPTNITAATGVVLSGVTHTGAVIPTVSAVTGLTAANLDAAVSSRMSTYAQPTGFLAATFPAGTVANTTNITAATGVVLSGVTHTGAVIPTVSTLTGHTAQTGDNFARLGAPSGVSVSADVAAVKAETASLQTDTNDIQTRIPAALVGGRMDSNASAINNIATSAARLARSTQGIVTGTVGAASSTTSIVTSALDPAAAVIDQYKGRIVVFQWDTTTVNLRGQATDITANTAAGVLTVTALTTSPVSGDAFVIV